MLWIVSTNLVTSAAVVLCTASGLRELFLLIQSFFTACAQYVHKQNINSIPGCVNQNDPIALARSEEAGVFCLFVLLEFDIMLVAPSAHLHSLLAYITSYISGLADQ